MKSILDIKQTNIVTDGQIKDSATYKSREAARAVLLNSQNQVIIMEVSKHGYFKLPGGGIDEGESIEEALARELLEEVGRKAELICELGIITEQRDYDDGGLIQKSYCYLARQVGESQEPSLEEGELAEGMRGFIAGSIEEAINLTEEAKPDNLEGKFIQLRDLTYLKEAKKYLDKL